MTVSSSTSRITYSGNGTTDEFAVPFRFLENSHLEVILADADDVETAQVLNTDYTLTGADDDAGGTLTMTTAPASGERLIIQRNVPRTQAVDYTRNDRFPAETHERALDKLTMMIQQAFTSIDRAAVLPDGYVGGASPALPIPGAGEYVRWNNAGTALETVPASPDSTTFTASGTGAVARSYSSKVGEVIHAADFGAVGDGVTDDTAAIQAALDAHGWVHLGGPGRTYLVEGITLADGEDYLIVGEGATLKLKAAATESILVNDDTTFIASLAILGVKFDGNKAGVPDWGAGPMAIHVDRLNIDGCEFHSHRNQLKLRHVATSARIHNCLFRDAAEHSGTLNQNAGYINILTATDRAVSTKQMISIQHNTFVGFVPSVAGRGVYGIILQGGEAAGFYEEDKTARAVIAGNMFWECGQDVAGNKAGAITLYRRGGRSIVANNWIWSGDEVGIDVQASENVIVTNNHIFDVTAAGISVAPRTDDGTPYPCKNVEVTDNLIIGSALCGVWARHSAAATGENISIVGNRIRECEQAIQVQYWSGQIVVDGNRISDTLDAAPATGQRCVDLLGDSGGAESVVMRVCNNVIEDSANSGIRIRYYDGQIMVDGNSIDGASPVSNEHALTIWDCGADVSIHGNMFSDVTDGADTDVISLSACTGRVTIKDNSFPSDGTLEILTTSNVRVAPGQGPATDFSTRSGAGAVDVIYPTTKIVTTGANALTLADGLYEGQTKTLIMTTDAGDGTLTPTNLRGGTTLTFDDVGDWAQLQFIGGEWTVIAGTATLA